MKQFFLVIGLLFFNISLQAQIVVNENPYPLIVCEDDNDGYAFFDLHQADEDITLGNSSLEVTYHQVQIDAENGINALISPYMNTVQHLDKVYARVHHIEEDVFAVVELDLMVVENLPVSQPINLVQTDDSGDGFAVFDLTENDEIVLEGLNPSYFTTSYYESQSDAELGESAIITPMTYQNIENPQTIYVRVENLDESCVTVDSFIISTESLSTESFGFENLEIFPNPTSGSVTIRSSELVSETTVMLYDIIGKVLLSEKENPLNNSITIDVYTFRTGVYFVKIASEGNVAVQKLIKK